MTYLHSNLPIFISESDITALHLKELDEKITNRRSILDSKTIGTSYLDCDALEYIRTEKKIAEITKQEPQNNLLLARQNVMLGNLNMIKHSANQLSQLMLGSSGKDLESVLTQIRSFLDSIQGLMNTPYNNENIFSGVDIDEPTLKNLKDLPPITENLGLVDYSYYNGGEGEGIIKVYDDTDFDRYSITGKDDFFAKIIHSARLCLTITDTTDIVNKPAFKTAMKLTKEALYSDFEIAECKLKNGKNKLESAISRAPADIIMLTKQHVKSNYVDQIRALDDVTAFEASKQNAQNIRLKQLILDRKLNQEIIDSMSKKNK